jgi:hypothetical protein
LLFIKLKQCLESHKIIHRLNLNNAGFVSNACRSLTLTCANSWTVGWKNADKVGHFQSSESNSSTGGIKNHLVLIIIAVLDEVCEVLH